MLNACGKLPSIDEPRSDQVDSNRLELERQRGGEGR